MTEDQPLEESSLIAQETARISTGVSSNCWSRRSAHRAVTLALAGSLAAALTFWTLAEPPKACGSHCLSTRRPSDSDDGTGSSSGGGQYVASEGGAEKEANSTGLDLFSGESQVDTEEGDQAESTLSEGASTEGTLREDASTEDASTEDASTEDVSTEDASTEHASTEDASTEHASTEDASTEHASTEGTPREDATTEDTRDEGLCGVNKPARDLPRCFSSPGASPSNGTWLKCNGGVKDSPVQKLYKSPQFSHYAKCHRSWQNLGHTGESRPYWEWEPEVCDLEPVDATKFCNVTAGFKGILIVGDSLSRLMTTTLGSMLEAKSVKAQNDEDKWLACDDKLNIRFIRNDYLNVRTKGSFAQGKCEHPGGRPAGNTMCRVFAVNRTLRDYDILIVNSGAHSRDLGEYMEGMTETSQFLAQQMEKLHGEKAFMVFRNTVPGHWGCDDM